MEHLLIMPQVFSEETILVFCKNEKKIEKAKILFDEYKKHLLGKWNTKRSPEKKKNGHDFGGKLFFDENEEKNRSTPKFGNSFLRKRERSNGKKNMDDSYEE